MSAEYVLEMNHISKEYFGIRVLNDVTFSVRPGEIHALMGENGAGKSTMMNILFGMPVIHSTGGYEGDVLIGGKKAEIISPVQAMDYGIGMVHQEFMLIPGFTITENIKIGREITKQNIFSTIINKDLESLDHTSMAKDAKLALETIGLDIDQRTLVRGLPVGHMQFIEIAREIDKEGIQLLVFDEPTAVLAESEADRLLEAMRVLADKGIAIIFISHRLDEVMAVADRMTVLRDGEFVVCKEIKDTSAVEIAELMIGRKVEALLDTKEDARQLNNDDIAMSIRNLHVDMPGERVRGIDLDIRKGEIFGIGGLAGQGKLGIPNGIMGLFPATGQVTVFGEELRLDALGDALKHKVAFVSEDRRGVGLLLDESIRHNVCFKAIQINHRFLKNFGITKLKDTKAMEEYARNAVAQLDIRCVGCHQKTGALSGGNQQKVCLASALALEPEILIVSEPTRGIDIGAKKLVIEHLTKLSHEKGMTIIMISSELVELRSICDRIALISEGQINGILPPSAPDAEFGLAMSGKRKERGA